MKRGKSPIVCSEPRQEEKNSMKNTWTSKMSQCFFRLSFDNMRGLRYFRMERVEKNIDAIIFFHQKIMLRMDIYYYYDFFFTKMETLKFSAFYKWYQTFLRKRFLVVHWINFPGSFSDENYSLSSISNGNSGGLVVEFFLFFGCCISSSGSELQTLAHRKCYLHFLTIIS